RPPLARAGSCLELTESVREPLEVLRVVPRYDVDVERGEGRTVQARCEAADHQGVDVMAGEDREDRRAVELSHAWPPPSRAGALESAARIGCSDPPARRL